MTGYRTYAIAIVWILSGLATLAGITIDETTREQIIDNLEAVIGGIAILAGIVTAIMRKITKP